MEGRDNSMWNCDWEYENQETLKQWYEEKLAGIRLNSIVRKIVCKGCGRDFYTLIETKKYCYYHLCGNRGYQKDLKQRRLEKRQNRVCKGCGKIFTICVLFTEEIGGIFTIAFEPDGNVVMETNFAEDDYLYDEIGSGLMVREISRNRQEMFESLSLYYRVFVLHEKLDLD